MNNKKQLKELISDELRGLRAITGLNIQEYSKIFSLNKDTMSRYENGKTNIPFDALEKILNYHNIDFVIFFTNVYARLHNCKKQETKEKEPI